MPEQRKFRALLAVRDQKARSALRGYLRARGDVVELGPDADPAEAARSKKPDLILLEIDTAGCQLASLRHEFATIPIVAVAMPSAELAFQAAKLGASELLIMPLDEQRISSLLPAVLDSLGSSNAASGPESRVSAELDTGIPSASPRMLEIDDTIEKVATTSATVLIRGESGVGKELVARKIFSRSNRRDKPFVKVNCAAIPHELLESELFGYDVGAFTGAQRSKPGKFELADRGTLFLDEIGEMHPALQAKLLHVLQDGQFARLGSKRDTAVDVRVLCATNRSLEQQVSEGLFREDLLYRINVITIQVPPLRQRRDEIGPLAQEFIEKYSVTYGRTVAPLHEHDLRALLQYSWPGNIRELENLCKRYVIMGDATQIVRELSLRLLDSRPTENVAAAQPPLEFPRSQEPSLLEIGRQAAWQAERQAIQNMLVETRWNRREAARRLRVSYKALLNKVKQMEMENFGQSEQLGSQ